MLFGIARVSFVTVSGFRSDLIMFDFGHRCSQFGCYESSSSAAVLVLLRDCYAVVCTSACGKTHVIVPQFLFDFDRSSMMLVSADIFCTVLLRLAQLCSLAREVFFLSMQFWAALFGSIPLVIGIAVCCSLMYRGDQCRWVLAVVYSAIFGAQHCFMLTIFSP